MRAIVSMQVRRSQSARLLSGIARQFDIMLDDAPVRTAGQGVAILGVGPGMWLMISSEQHDGLAPQLRAALGEAASFTDLSAAYLMFRLSGARVRETLAKLLPIDLHPRILPVNGVVRSVAAHVAVLLWRLEDDAGHAVFELATPRSSAASLCHALSMSAAEFGVEWDLSAQPDLALLVEHGAA